MKTRRGLVARILTYEWRNNLTLLLIALFLYQYVEWFSEYWREETKSFVVYALIAIYLTEIVPRLHWIIRRFLQLFVLLAIDAFLADYHPIGGSVHGIAGLLSLIADNLVQITPYIWFSLASWIIYLVAIWWMRTKVRIFILFISSVVLFASVDSFSLFIFWDQVALLIFCGLALIILHHFDQFRVKNPQSWEYISEYPSLIVLPIIALITLVMIAGILAPDINPLVTDPYTAWKNFKGEPVFTGGKGTVKVFGFQGNSSSGYSRNDAEIGSGFDFDYTPVMTVDTTHSSYWRGETRSVYNGRGWEQSASEKQGELVPVKSDAPLPRKIYPNNAAPLSSSQSEVSKLETKEIRQTFTLLKEEGYPVLFGALSIQSVENVDGGDKGSPTPAQWSPQHEEIRWAEEFANDYPSIYSIVSQMPVIDEEGLRSAVAVSNPAQWAEYLQLPDSLPPRVGNLALEVTQSAATSYDKVKLLESYLKENYPYTNKPNVGKAQSKDFVDSFLFEIQEGYCDYYSSAMVVLSRSLGIPARWVKGYAPGQLPIEQFVNDIPREQLDLEGPGRYTVRNADAHSWVEVYFPGWGWIPFEPTAGFSLPSIEAQEDIDLSAIDPGGSKVSDDKSGYGWSSGWTIGLLAAMLILAVGWLLYRKYGQFPLLGGIGRRLKKEANASHKVVIEFNKFLRFSRRKGFSRFEHETARETVHRWTDRNRWLQKDLEGLLVLFEQAKYSRSPLTDDDYDNTVKYVKRLREEMGS